MYTKLRDEDVDCLIIDAPLADYWTLEINENGRRRAITKMKELHTLRLLKKEYFDMVINEEDCDDEEVKISMKELAGLWIVLAIAIGVSLLLFLIKKLGFVKFPSNYMSPYYNYFSTPLSNQPIIV